MCANLEKDRAAPREGYIPVGSAELYYREVGQGHPIIVLHGGPDFDHRYLLPGMDRLSGGFRLIYYDQRGRGQSARDVQPEDVSMHSEVEDLEALRQHLQLESTAVLGHSWGGLLALEYALHHPDRVSHLILMNTAPVSHDDFLLMRQDRRTRAAADLEELQTRSFDPRYQAGDPDAVADYCRVHFRQALRRPEHLEPVIASLRGSFTKEGILKAREIETRLVNETWMASEYDLLPEARRLAIPTLVIHGEYDFIPTACAAHIANAIPGARLVLLKECGHFAYLERPDEVCREVAEFFVGG